MVYDWSKPNEALELIKTNILLAMKKEEDWYDKYTKRHSFFSRVIRFLSILLFAFGTLCPILNTGLDEKSQIGLNWGYVSLAIGGLLLLVDKYLGVSSGYVRFYLAKLDIQKNTFDFIENWDIESAKASNPLTKENIVSLLNTVKAFRQSVFTTIQVETGAWATEFQTQTGELYELFKQKQSDYKTETGNISVIIENHIGYSEIEIVLDDKIINKLEEGNTSTIFRNISLAPHKILIRAIKEGETVSFSKNVEVTIDKTAEVILTLPG